MAKTPANPVTPVALAPMQQNDLVKAGVSHNVLADAARAGFDWPTILSFLVNGGLAGLIKAIKDALSAVGHTPTP